MLSDVVAVALISSAFPAVVAVIAAIAAVLGPSWQKERDRKAEATKTAEDLRYERALELFEALAKVTVAKSHNEIAPVHIARSRFVAILRPGEGPVADYVGGVIKKVSGNWQTSLPIIDEAQDRIFAWLRGETDAASFAKKAA